MSRYLTALFLLVATLSAADAEARKYRIGDSVEITAESSIVLYTEPDETVADGKSLDVGEGNTFDVEAVVTIDEVRWLKIRVFHRIVTELSERYKTIGRGWITREQLDGRAQRESTSWSSGVAAHAPSKAPPVATSKPKPKPKNGSTPAAGQGAAAAQGSVAETPKDAPGGGPGLTRALATEIAAQFRQLHGNLKSANAILQGGMVTMVVQSQGELSLEEAQALGASFVAMFRPYNYKYLVYVTDEKGKAITSGKQDVGATTIGWAESKKKR